MSISYQQVLDFLNTSPYFSQLTEGDRQRLVKEFDLISLTPEQVLFYQDDPADAFYVVMEGRLGVSRVKNHRVVNESVIQVGDPIGEEAFARAESYRATVTATTDVILLRLRNDRLSELIDQIPRLSGCRSLLSGTAQLSRVANLDWLNRDERLVALTRKSSFFFFIRSILPGMIFLIGLILFFLNLRGIVSFPPPPLIGIAACMAAALLWIFWIGLDWANDYYILTSRRLVRVDRTAGVFDRREEVPLGNIMAVEMSTTALGKMYGFADIASRTYNMPVVWHGISHPELCVALIEYWSERVRSNHAELEMADMQAALDRQIGGASRDDDGIPDEEQTSESVRLSTITFHKHWVILFKKTWLPFTFGITGLLILLGNLTRMLAISISDPIKWLLGMTVATCVIWYGYRFLDWSNDIYMITSDQIMDVKRTPLGREERKTAMLENILSINYRRRGLLGVLLNYGTVNIQVGTESLIFDYVRDPSGVQREVFRRMAERQSALKQADIDSERERMSQWIAAYHRRINE